MVIMPVSPEALGIPSRPEVHRSSHQKIFQEKFFCLLYLEDDKRKGGESTIEKMRSASD
jgi:hypothetical protein